MGALCSLLVFGVLGVLSYVIVQRWGVPALEYLLWAIAAAFGLAAIYVVCWIAGIIYRSIREYRSLKTPEDE
jgi:hypothetical protein